MWARASSTLPTRLPPAGAMGFVQCTTPGHCSGRCADPEPGVRWRWRFGSMSSGIHQPRIRASETHVTRPPARAAAINSAGADGSANHARRMSSACPARTDDRTTPMGKPARRMSTRRAIPSRSAIQARSACIPRACCSPTPQRARTCGMVGSRPDPASVEDEQTSQDCANSAEMASIRPDFARFCEVRYQPAPPTSCSWAPRR